MRRWLVCLVMVTAVAALVGCQQTATTTVSLDCDGAPEAVTVTATMPKAVPSGAAFPLTIETAGTVGGAVALTLTNATPGLVAVEGTGTLQVASTGDPGNTISVAVARVETEIFVDDPADPYDQTWKRVTCVPTSETSVGSIATLRPRAAAEPGSTPLDASFHLWCSTSSPQGSTEGPGGTRVAVSVPTHVTPGQTFTLPDLTVDVQGSQVYAVAVTGATEPSGTGYVQPSTPITVSAEAGGHVSVRLSGLLDVVGGQVVGSCSPLASGHVATIPVVAGPS